MSDYDDCDDWFHSLPLDSPSGAGGAVPPTLAALVQPGPGAYHQVTANTLQCYTSYKTPFLTPDFSLPDICPADKLSMCHPPSHIVFHP